MHPGETQVSGVSGPVGVGEPRRLTATLETPCNGSRHPEVNVCYREPGHSKRFIIFLTHIIINAALWTLCVIRVVDALRCVPLTAPCTDLTV